MPHVRTRPDSHYWHYTQIQFPAKSRLRRDIPLYKCLACDDWYNVVWLCSCLDVFRNALSRVLVQRIGVLEMCIFRFFVKCMSVGHVWAVTVDE